MIARFWLHRKIDETGVSGTGYVAEGVQWSDGTVTLKWYGDHSSTVQWESVDDMIAIHGHHGQTFIRWCGSDLANKYVDRNGKRVETLSTEHYV